MKTLKIVLSDERLITPSGLSFVGQILGKSRFIKNCNRHQIQKGYSQPQIKNGDILLTYIGLLCQGKTEYDKVKEMVEDPDFYQTALGISYQLPSSETLRQRMDQIGNSLRSEILEANLEMFSTFSTKPTALDSGLVPVDIDVTPFDNSKTKKEGVSRTYKGFDGYAPIMAYIGTEGYLANTELREGKQHCQKKTPEFLQETLDLCHKMTENNLLIRMDAGNDAAVNLGILLEDGSKFVIKRNLRRSETKVEWLSKVTEHCKDIRQPRDGKTVYIGSDWKDVKYIDKDGIEQTICLRICYEVIERTINKHGQYLMENTVEVNTFWTNLGFSDDEIIQQYHNHGESEQFHSEIKTDMDVERLPSGKFATNQLVLTLTILAYNILRMLGQASLKSKHAPKTKRPVKRRRLRTVIENLIFFAGHVTSHARSLRLSLGRRNLWSGVFIDIFYGFLCKTRPSFN